MSRARWVSRLAVVVAGLGTMLPLAVPATAVGTGVWSVTRYSTIDHEYISSFPNGVAYLAHERGYARSLDNGVTHHPMPAPDLLVDAWSSIRFGSPQVGYAISEYRHYDSVACTGSPRIWRTTDGGLGWQPTCLPTTPAGYRFRSWPFGWSLAVSPGGNGVLVLGEEVETPADPGSIAPGVCLDHQSVAYLSTNGGTTWTRFELGGSDLVMPAFFREMYSDNTAVFTLYHLRSVGTCTWGEPVQRIGDWQEVVVLDAVSGLTSLLECRKPQPLCTATVALDDDTLLVGRADASTAVTQDGGVTWSSGQALRGARGLVVGTAPESQFWVQAFDFSDPRNGYASTNGFGTWRTEDGGGTWHQERSHECEHRAGSGGDISTASASRAIVGGPTLVSTRTAEATAPLTCEGVTVDDDEPGDRVDFVADVAYTLASDAEVRVQIGVHVAMD